MKWQQVIKAGKLPFDNPVIFNSTTKGVKIGTLGEKKTTASGTDYVFVSGDETFEDVTHFAVITDPLKPAR